MIDQLIKQYKSERRWDQKCLILNTIHTGLLLENKGWRLRDTALLVGISVAACSEDISIAQHLDILGNATSRNHALKTIRMEKNDGNNQKHSD